MNKQELNNFMATKIMGFVLSDNGECYGTGDELLMEFDDWHPSDNFPDSLGQAIMCAEKWQSEDPQNRRVELIKSLTEWECNLYTFSSKDYWTLICDAYGQELSIVVCEAIKHVMEAK